MGTSLPFRHVVVRALPVALAATACGESRGRDTAVPGVAVTAVTSGPRHLVEVTGVEGAALARLSELSPDDARWARLVAIRVEQAGDTGTMVVEGESRTPPVIGRYSATEDGVRFEPRFPFAAGVSYRVDVDTAGLSRIASAEVAWTGDTAAARLIHRYTLPTTERQRTTRVVAVHPSAAQLPSNLLRFYVEFSAPMEPGNALEHVRLMDASGREVTGAFLVLDQELWDPERRRLTLLLDPGRVKRGVRTNLESGAPLVPGRRYTLVIDDEWVDGTGASIASGFEQRFESVGDDRASPHPRHWRLAIPGAGTRDGMHVAFGEALDHALAGRMLSVRDATGRLVPGSARLTDGDSAWSFAPATDWKAGDYTLRVDNALEDVAGNNVARVFDLDRRANGDSTSRVDRSASTTVTFRIVATA